MTAAPDDDEEEVFELELWGGATERRYRSMRDDVAALPWGSLDTSRMHPAALAEAQRMWTAAAFQEHRTGAMCSAALRCLFECRAPIDLVGVFSRFPLDEIAHVEMAARMATELGGVVELRHTVNDVVRDPERGASTMMRAAELVVKTFCVGESLSIPLLHAAWRGADQPLARGVLGRIVRDEAAHGVVGWTFLDWAAPFLDERDRARLGAFADEAIGEIAKLWTRIERRAKGPVSAPNGIGWIGDEPYLALALRTMATHVVRPLLERRITVDVTRLHPGVREHLRT